MFGYNVSYYIIAEIRSWCDINTVSRLFGDCGITYDIGPHCYYGTPLLSWDPIVIMGPHYYYHSLSVKTIQESCVSLELKTDVYKLVHFRAS